MQNWVGIKRNPTAFTRFSQSSDSYEKIKNYKMRKYIELILKT